MVQVAGGAGVGAGAVAASDGGGASSSIVGVESGSGEDAWATGAAHAERKTSARATDEECMPEFSHDLAGGANKGVNKGSMAWQIAAVTSSLLPVPSSTTTDESALANAR